MVVDAGLDPFELRSDLAAGHRPVCVLRSCYLALTRAQRVSGPYDRVVLVEEPGRALRVRDVAAARRGLERRAGGVGSPRGPVRRRGDDREHAPAAAAALRAAGMTPSAAADASGVGRRPGGGDAPEVGRRSGGGDVSGVGRRPGSGRRCRRRQGRRLRGAGRGGAPQGDRHDDGRSDAAARHRRHRPRAGPAHTDGGGRRRGGPGRGPGARLGSVGAAARRRVGERGDDQRSGAGVDRAGRDREPERGVAGPGRGRSGHREDRGPAGPPRRSADPLRGRPPARRFPGPRGRSAGRGSTVRT